MRPHRRRRNIEESNKAGSDKIEGVDDHKIWLRRGIARNKGEERNEGEGRNNESGRNKEGVMNKGSEGMKGEQGV